MEILPIQGHDVAILSWLDVEQATRLVAAQVRESSFSPSLIVGISRGGFIPAVWLCHLLGVERISTLEVRTTRTNEIRAERVADSGYDVVATGYRNEQILIVDDVTNTGTTLRTARQVLESSGCAELRIAALFRDTVNADDMLEVDFVGPSVNAWTGFPWER